MRASKILLLLIIMTGITKRVFSFERGDSTKKHEIGIGFLMIPQPPKGFYGWATNPSLIYLNLDDKSVVLKLPVYNLSYRLNLLNTSFRLGFSFEYPQPNQIGYFDANIGLQKFEKNTYNRRLRYYVGLDGAFSYQKYDDITDTRTFNRIYRIGVVPIIGFNYKLVKQISISCESDFIFFFYTDQKYTDLGGGANNHFNFINEKRKISYGARKLIGIFFFYNL